MFNTLAFSSFEPLFSPKITTSVFFLDTEFEIFPPKFSIALIASLRDIPRNVPVKTKVFP